MNVVIDRRSEEPVQAQVARQIRGFIASGQLAPGAALPPVRTLASDLGVNLNTVARAYRSLEDEGFLAIRDRYGAVVAPPAARARRADVQRLAGELRTALARLRQAGLARSELERLVREEIDALGDGA